LRRFLTSRLVVSVGGRGVASIPVLIGASFLAVGLRRRRSRLEGPVDVGLLELASALLALLALRQVLVPGNIISFTDLDDYLAIELAVIVGGTLIGFLVVASRTDADATESADSSPARARRSSPIRRFPVTQPHMGRALRRRPTIRERRRTGPKWPPGVDDR
jgi:hypothetical protein